jgi:hypothetical protein
LPTDKFPDLDKILGVDFRKVFLQQLDTSVVTWGAHSEGPFFLGQGFAVKVKDAAKVKKSLQAIANVVGKQDDKLVSAKRMYRGHEMQVFNKLPIPFTYTLHNDWLVFGLFPQPVQGFLLRSGGQYRTWKMPPESAVAFNKHNGKSKLFSMSVSDPRPTIEIGLAVLPVFFQAVNASAGFRAIDVNEIPNAQSINEWLFPNVALAFDDGYTLRWEHLYSINEPDDLLLAQVLSYAIPSLGLGPLRIPIGANAPKGFVELPEPAQRTVNAEDVKQPALRAATAVEIDGEVEIRIVVNNQVPYTVSKRVPVFEEKTVAVDGEKKKVKYCTYITVQEQVIKDVKEIIVLKADGKNVKVTRKDGKTVEPKDLPMLLKEETQVLLVRDGEIERAVLDKLDERTLIVRVAP